MSWPADGKPRFYLSEISGSLTEAATSSRTLENITVAVHDRAFCHSVVAKYRSELRIGGRGKLTGAMARAKVREVGLAKLAALEAADQKMAA